jgi:hypothetical protein
MKYGAWKLAVTAGMVLTLTGWASPAKGQDGDNDGCSNATLSGDYGFTLHGESLGVLVPQTGGPPKLLPFASPLLADGVAMTHFNGNGSLTQVDFVMRNGTSAATPGTLLTSDGFRAGETGTYHVNHDCTGWFKLQFLDTTEVDVAFVLARGGREIRTVVIRQHVPALPPAIIPLGATCAAATGGCDLGVQIRSDGAKLDIWAEAFGGTPDPGVALTVKKRHGSPESA